MGESFSLPCRNDYSAREGRLVLSVPLPLFLVFLPLVFCSSLHQAFKQIPPHLLMWLQLCHCKFYKGQSLLNVAFDRQIDVLELFYSLQGLSIVDQA